jgi:AraC-like DNA-binding protein
MTNLDDSKRLEDARAYVRAHCGDAISVDSLSRSAGMCATKFKRMFRERYGVTVYGFVKATRMKRAALLLAESDYPVSEVAGMVGYEKPGAFAAAFRAQTGMSPSEYRRCAIRTSDEEAV